MNNQTKAFIGFGIIAVAVVALVLFLNRKPAEKNLLDINVPKPNVKINGKDVFKEEGKGPFVPQCDCDDCRADCACGCKRVHGPMVDDKSFMDLSKDPKFINGISELVAKLVSMLGDAEANAPKWVRVISDRAERTNEQLQMVLYLLGGILAAQVLNGFLVYGNLNALGKK